MRYLWGFIINRMPVSSWLRRKFSRNIPSNSDPLLNENKINYNPFLSAYLVERNIFSDHPFFLLDVGAGGGIQSHWNVFGGSLMAIGFESLTLECERLNRANTLPLVHYINKYIISGIPEVDLSNARNLQTSFIDRITFLSRSSSVLMQQIKKINYEKDIFNFGMDFKVASEQISIDAYCSENSLKKVDFLKVDTDGYDYQVLLGASNLLRDSDLLGVSIEFDYNASGNPYANSFRNVDALLTNLGFTLYDISAYRYTRKALPGKFLYRIPAQTQTGQTLWGDALYLRDLVSMKKQGKFVSDMQVIKMSCIFEIFGLPDCAAELLLEYSDQLREMIDVNYCLDLLAKDMGMFSNYKDHVNSFNTDPESFYPSN